MPRLTGLRPHGAAARTREKDNAAYKVLWAQSRLGVTTVTALARDCAIAIALVAGLPVEKAMILEEGVDRPWSRYPRLCAARIGPESFAAALAAASRTTSALSPLCRMMRATTGAADRAFLSLGAHFANAFAWDA